MSMENINELSAVELSKAVKAGQLTSEAIVCSCLERIEAREADVQAWAYIDTERALAEARAVDETGPKAPLYGLPIGFKDVIDTADIPTAYGADI